MSIIIYNNYTKNINIDYKKIIKEAIKETLLYEGFKQEFEISVSIVNNEEIKLINKKFRNIDKTTDVLSFPSANISLSKNTIDNVEIGDIIISFDKVLSQSQEYGHKVERELAFLVTHSVLHILGYQHNTEEQYEIIINKQNNILTSLNLNR
jgi:probable rRNA maturation factor